MKIVICKIIALVVAVYSLSTVMAEEAQILGFSVWKDQQVIEAQNHMVRLSNKIVVDRKRLAGEAPEEMVMKALKLEEEELSLRKESLLFAQGLTFEDYTINYLSNYSNNDQFLLKVLERLTRAEKLTLIKSHLRLRQSKGLLFRPRITGVSNANDEIPTL